MHGGGNFITNALDKLLCQTKIFLGMCYMHWDMSSSLWGQTGAITSIQLLKDLCCWITGFDRIMMHRDGKTQHWKIEGCDDAKFLIFGDTGNCHKQRQPPCRMGRCGWHHADSWFFQWFVSSVVCSCLFLLMGNRQRKTQTVLLIKCTDRYDLSESVNVCVMTRSSAGHDIYSKCLTFLEHVIVFTAGNK